MLRSRKSMPAVTLLLLITLALGGVTLQVLARPAQGESLQVEQHVFIVLRETSVPQRIPPPASFKQGEAAPQAATIQVNYIGAWTPDAITAFEYSASIWALLLTSPVTIRVDAKWEPLPAGVLGGARALEIYRDFSGAPVPNTWYPVALANKLRGLDLSPAISDIEATFNSAFGAWYFGTGGGTPPNQVDFASVVLHELGHGLGFFGSMAVSGGLGSWGYGTSYPAIYDRFTENGVGQALLNTTLFPNYSAQLASQLTSNNIYFDGPLANAGNQGQRVKLYAPSTWQQGSSYSHLDQLFNNTPNALMTYSIGYGEWIHNPGTVTLGMFDDMGWGNPAPAPTATRTPTRTATQVPATPTITLRPDFTASDFAYLPGLRKNFQPTPSPTATPTRTPTPQPSLTPAVTSTQPAQQGIYGQVTQYGVGVQGIGLELRFFNGVSHSTRQSTTTGAGGYFAFTGVPSLLPGQRYTVRYSNDIYNPVSGRLWGWVSRPLDAYTNGQHVWIGPFDIGDIELLDPPYAATISTPYTFRWVPRPASPTDSYELDLYGENYEDWYTPWLGYVGEYTLNQRPGGFVPGPPYYWEVWVKAPDNAYGVSLAFNRFYFSASTLVAGEALLLPRRADLDIHQCAYQPLLNPSGVPASLALAPALPACNTLRQPG